MSLPRQETPTPSHSLIEADRQTQRRGVYGFRPKGAKDWLLTYTIAGGAIYRSSKGTFRTAAGDLLLIQPGVPHDYEVNAQIGFWSNIWIHFNPRPHQQALLQWPENGRGHFVIRVPGERRTRIYRQLAETVRFLKTMKPLCQLRAMNAFERALLECADIGPAATPDPPISRVQEFIHDHFLDHLTLDEMAARSGLSRTRFADRFQRQLGETPYRYVEKLRLNHARQLWEYGHLTLGEIADRLNYSSSYYLSLRFKREFGLSPLAYRKKLDRDEVKRPPP